MRIALWTPALAPVLAACSLAYLTDHAGDVQDTGVEGGLDAAPTDGGRAADAPGAFDASGANDSTADAPGPVVVDDVDAGWSIRVDASAGFGDLSSVWGSGANDVWAVGFNTIVHWDGSAWSLSPAEVGPLNSVWGSGPDDVWTVGQGGAIFHFDGTVWLPSDAGTRATLNGVWGSAPDDVWAVGESDGGGPVFHWNGAAWALSATLDAGLQSVWGTAGLVWTVGDSNFIAERSAGAWSAQDNQVSVPDDLTGVWGSSATSIWAVSQDGPIVYYAGDQDVWVAQTMGFGLLVIWGTSSGDVWGAGFGGTIAHYDGHAWSAVPSGTRVGLTGVWGTGPNDVWVVGAKGTILHHP
ncbi:MAG TPA: hypothetical protein VHV30_08240 [Polyangiaceae bacterium]|nr:hypothetical protein [Polyangiaceae bacterium]